MKQQAVKIREFAKQSRGKIWIRTILLAIFGTLFSFSLAEHLSSGAFSLYWGLSILLPCLALGFWMSRLVPMHIHHHEKVITFSFDKIYFVLIWVLVIGKLIASQVFDLPFLSSLLMCAILGLMSGRLSGICWRVRMLKIEHALITG